MCSQQIFFRNVPSRSSYLHNHDLPLPDHAAFLHCGRDYSCQHASSLLSLVRVSVNGLSITWYAKRTVFFFLRSSTRSKQVSKNSSHAPDFHCLCKITPLVELLLWRSKQWNKTDFVWNGTAEYTASYFNKGCVNQNAL